MTREEFQTRYHAYMTYDKEVALKEAASVTIEDGTHPVVMEFPLVSGSLYCLMVESAVDALDKIFGDSAPRRVEG